MFDSLREGSVESFNLNYHCRVLPQERLIFFLAHDLNLNLKGPQTFHHFNSLELLNWQLNNLIG